MLRLETRHVEADVSFRQRTYLADIAAEKAAPKRAEGNKSNTQLFARIENGGFRIARPKRIFGLHRSYPMNRMGFTQGCGGDFR